MHVGVFFGDRPQDAGGGFTFTGEVFESLADVCGESHHQFSLICGASSAEAYAERLRNLPIRVVTYKQPGLLGRGLEMLRRYVPIFRRWAGPSPVERAARAAGVEFIWFACAGTVPVDLPYLTVVWDLQHRLQPYFPEVSAAGEWDTRELAYVWFLQRASVIIAGTLAGRDEIERFYQVPIERIRILPHPTPRFALNAPEKKLEGIPKKYGIPEHGFLLYPAQFWAHKNHVNLLLAIGELRDKHGLTVHLVLVGSDKGNLAHVQQRTRERGLSPQVHFLGFVPQDELVWLYRHALALVYVTLCGPENMPPLEAFALGCLVVASRVAGAEEQLGNAALLVDPKSPGHIAAAIKSIHDDAELRNLLTQRGRERALKWRGQDFVRGVFSILDEFEPIRRCWGR